MRCIPAFLLLFFLGAPQACFALGLSERIYLEQILSQIMTTNSNTDNIIIGKPDNPEAANEIINRAIIIASWDQPWQVAQDNPKNKDGSQNYPLKIRKNLVDDTICRKFGYDASAWPLLSGKDRQDFDGAFYSLNAGDGGMDAKIIKARIMDNGLLKVKGEFTFGEDDENEFTAFFAPAKCGGYDHWVPRSIYYDDFPDEKSEGVK